MYTLKMIHKVTDTILGSIAHKIRSEVLLWETLYKDMVCDYKIR